jgi:hypothetical protein
MATLMPVMGEFLEMPGSTTIAGIAILLGGAVRHITDKNGSTWWFLNPIPSGICGNTKATRFLINRMGGAYTPRLYGPVLYLSKAESETLQPSPAVTVSPPEVKTKVTVEAMVPVRGRTYDVKEKLKTLGARWDAVNKVWSVPQSRLAEAEAIVRKGQ